MRGRGLQYIKELCILLYGSHEISLTLIQTFRSRLKCLPISLKTAFEHRTINFT